MGCLNFDHDRLIHALADAARSAIKAIPCSVEAPCKPASQLLLQSGRMRVTLQPSRAHNQRQSAARMPIGQISLLAGNVAAGVMGGGIMSGSLEFELTRTFK